MDTQNNQSLAAQEQACQSFAAARGLRVGNLIPQQELERHPRDDKQPARPVESE